MNTDSVKVFAPATVSNVGPGFDIMGFALYEPGDEVILKKNNTGKLRIVDITGDNGKLSYSPAENTVTIAMKSLLNELELPDNFDVVLNKKMGIGSGLGSSAASAVAGVFALNKLLGLNLSNDMLLNHALIGEKFASGSIHADNVAPCLYGGFILIRGYEPIDIIPLNSPVELYCTAVYPDIEIKTSEARKILPQMYSINDTIKQAGNSAALVAGLLTSNFELISRSIVDVVAEPYRSKLIPFYNKLRDVVLTTGALNCNISGSGPTMFALSANPETAEKIAESMKTVLNEENVNHNIYISRVNKTGPEVRE